MPRRGFESRPGLRPRDLPGPRRSLRFDDDRPAVRPAVQDRPPHPVGLERRGSPLTLSHDSGLALPVDHCDPAAQLLDQECGDLRRTSAVEDDAGERLVHLRGPLHRLVRLPHLRQRATTLVVQARIHDRDRRMIREGTQQGHLLDRERPREALRDEECAEHPGLVPERNPQHRGEPFTRRRRVEARIPLQCRVPQVVRHPEGRAGREDPARDADVGRHMRVRECGGDRSLDAAQAQMPICLVVDGQVRDVRAQQLVRVLDDRGEDGVDLVECRDRTRRRVEARQLPFATDPAVAFTAVPCTRTTGGPVAIAALLARHTRNRNSAPLAQPGLRRAAGVSRTATAASHKWSSPLSPTVTTRSTVGGRSTVPKGVR